MKNIKILRIIISLIIVISLTGSGFVFAKSNSNETLLSLSVKNKEIGVEIFKEKDAEGPLSFFVSNDKTINIVDTVNKRILEFKNNKLINKISLNHPIDIMDIFIDDSGTIYLLDEVYSIIKLDKKGVIQAKYKIPRIDENKHIKKFPNGQEVVGYFHPRYINVINGEIHVTFQNNIDYVFNDKKLTKNTLEYEVSLSDRPTYKKKDSKDNIVLQYEGEPMEISLLKEDNSGNEFLSLNCYYEDGSLSSKSGIYEEMIQIINEGKIIGIAGLKENTIFRPNRSVQITDNGEIYQMVVCKNNVNIYNIIPSKNYYSKIAEFKQDNPKKKQTENIVPEITAKYMSYSSSLTKSDVASNIIDYLIRDWIYNSDENGDKSVTGNSNEVTQPDFLRSSSLNDGEDHWIDEGDIPYCWGAWDNPYEFITNIQNGYYAGNVDSKYSNGDYHGYISGTAGTDCSGFVSACYELPDKHGTNPDAGEYYLAKEAEPYYTGPFIRRGTWTTGQYLDIFMKSGHTMIADEYDTYNGNSGYWVWESTTRGEDKVQYVFRESSYVQGFDAYRYMWWN